MKLFRHKKWVSIFYFCAVFFLFPADQFVLSGFAFAQEQNHALTEKEISKNIKNLKSKNTRKAISSAKELVLADQDLTHVLPQIKEAFEKQKTIAVKIVIFKLLMTINPNSEEVDGLIWYLIENLAQTETPNLKTAFDALTELAQTNDLVVPEIIENFDRNPVNFGLLLGKVGSRAEGAAKKLNSNLEEGLPLLYEYLDNPILNFSDRDIFFDPSSPEKREAFLQKKYFSEMSFIIFALAKIGSSGLIAKENILDLAIPMLAQSEHFSFSYSENAINLNNRDRVLGSILQYLFGFYEIDNEIQNFTNLELPSAPLYAKANFAMLLSENTEIEDKTPFTILVKKFLEDTDCLHRFLILYSMENMDMFGAEEMELLRPLMEEDIGVIDPDLIYHRPSSGLNTTMTMGLFDLLRDIELAFPATTPDLVFARNETDETFKRKVLLARLESDKWYTCVNAIQGFSEAGFYDKEIIDIIIFHWNRYDLPGDLAIIRTLAKIGNSENGAIEFLQSRSFGQIMGLNTSPMQNEVNLALDEIRARSKK